MHKLDHTIVKHRHPSDHHTGAQSGTFSLLGRFSIAGLTAIIILLLCVAGHGLYLIFRIQTAKVPPTPPLEMEQVVSRSVANIQSLLSLALWESLLPAFVAMLLIGCWSYLFINGMLKKRFQQQLEHLKHRLAYREELLGIVSDNQPSGLTVFDSRNRYWFINRNAAEKLGQLPTEVIGSSPAKFMDARESRVLEERLAQARAAGGEIIDAIDRIKTIAGCIKIIRIRCKAVAPLEELSNSVLVTEDDITSSIVEREHQEQMLQQLVDTLVAVVDRRDPFAAGHSAQVGSLAQLIASEMQLDEQKIKAASIAGSLMNFGKVLLPRALLIKTVALTAKELQTVREGILTSADILAIIGFDCPVAPTLRQVLEKYDGSGIPNGLAGQNIMVTARIVTVANAYIALVSNRAHRQGVSGSEAIKQLEVESGKSYDPHVLSALQKCLQAKIA